MRPRWGRLAALSASVTVTTIAVLGAAQGGAAPAAEIRATATAAHPAALAADPTPDPAPATRSGGASTTDRVARRAAEQVSDPALPAHSGSGRRVVLSEERQRVWLVGADGVVRRTYLVSGSVEDNLHPGTYAVYSRSRWAVGVDDSGVMQYFVRFTRGPTGAAIGFHTIPTKDGRALQTRAQLGTPRSHGCVRQRTTDAIALWEFAPIGTPVVVTD